MEREGPVSRPRYEAYIFDLDGTIFTLPVDWKAARDRVSKIVGEPLGGKHLFPLLAEVTTRHPEMKEGLFAALDSFEMAAVPGSRPIEGALELLRLLGRSSGVALVTMKGARACSKILQKNGFAGFFRAVITREVSLDRVAQLWAALRVLGAPPKAVLFVGDMQNDVVSAKIVGTGVALLRRTPSREARPDHAFAGISDLRAFLRRMPSS